MNDLFEVRSEADYQDERIFSKEEAFTIITKAKTFLAGIGQALNNYAGES